VLTVLVVSPRDPAVDRLASGHPSIEILHAHDSDEALEKLGRNRRIDAVLLVSPTGTAAAVSEIVAEIRDDNPAPPPIFVLGLPDQAVPGIRSLPAGPLEPALAALERELTSET
jgi:uroporphyrinogen-III synthase